jgi:cyanophycinase-like exopeptidase
MRVNRGLPTTCTLDEEQMLMESPEPQSSNYDLLASFVEDNGSAAQPEVDDQLRRLVKLSGHRWGRIVILTAACPDPINQGRHYARRLLSVGGGLVEVLHIDSRLQANDEHAVGLVAQATCIVMPGNQRARLATLLDGTELLQTIRRRQSEGCVVAATRPGASLLGLRADIVL